MALLFPRSTTSFLVLASVLLFLFVWSREAELFHPSFETSCSSSEVDPLGKSGSSSFRAEVEAATSVSQDERSLFRVAVLNLASRPDRRKHMSELAALHSFDVEFVNATTYNSPEIIWLHERMYDDAMNVTWTFNKTSTDTWKTHFLTTSPSKLKPPPSPALSPAAKQLVNFPAYVGGVDSLPGPFACFVSHLKLLRSIVDEDWAGTTLVLEDDVDLEWRFSEIWQEVVGRSIPKELDWHLIYLGYSFTDELLYKPVHHPGLRPSYAPLGTYSYAVSRAGAFALLDYLSQPDVFLAAPIDHIFRWFIFHDAESHQNRPVERKTLSFVPAIVAHGGKHDFGSDIGGTSNLHVTMLADSTIERLERFKEADRERVEAARLEQFRGKASSSS